MNHMFLYLLKVLFNYNEKLLNNFTWICKYICMHNINYKLTFLKLIYLAYILLICEIWRKELSFLYWNYFVMKWYSMSWFLSKWWFNLFYNLFDYFIRILCLIMLSILQGLNFNSSLVIVMKKHDRNLSQS